MAVTASWGNTNKLEGSFASLARNVLASAWFKSSGTTAGTIITTSSSSGTITDGRDLNASIGGGKPTWTVASGGTPYTVTTAATFTTGQWEHAAGYDPLADARYVFLNATETALTGVVSSTPGAGTVTRIGSRFDGTRNASTYEYAEISLWDVSALSTVEIASLVTRLYTLVNTTEIPNPRTINEDIAEAWTGKLLRYYPLTTNSDLSDALSSGDNFTASGTISTATHPTVETYTPPSNLYPDTEALYLGATLLSNKTNIEFKVTAGHTGLNGEILSAGTNATTDGSGLLQLPSAITGTASDPVTLHLYWQEGSEPVSDRSLIVKTTLVAV